MSWLMLQRADIWERQIELSILLCRAVLCSAPFNKWALNFWQKRQEFRLKDPVGLRVRSDFSSSPFGSNNDTKNTATGAITDRPTGHVLALVLLEVALQRSISSSMSGKHQSEVLQSLSPFVTEAQARMGVTYAKVIRHCLDAQGLPQPGSSTSTEELVFRAPEHLSLARDAGFRAIGFDVIKYEPSGSPEPNLEWKRTPLVAQEKWDLGRNAYSMAPHIGNHADFNNRSAPLMALELFREQESTVGLGPDSDRGQIFSLNS